MYRFLISDLRRFAWMRNSTNKFPFSAVRSRYSEARKWMISPVSRQSWYALDCLNFLVASVQIGLGTFVAFYLASLGWSKETVGLALASGQIAGVLGQIPGGAITDAITWKRGFAALGILMSMGAALIFAAAPQFALVFVAEILDGLTAAIVPLAIAGVSLGVVGQRAMSLRTGRNYRFANRRYCSRRRCPRPYRQLFRKECDLLCHRGVVHARSCGA
jgi:hypothetical protein